jgi:hypothetical protein
LGLNPVSERPKEEAMKRVGKLRLHKETLAQIDTQGTIKGGFDSCIDSCYLVSCDGGCGISTGQTSD